MALGQNIYEGSGRLLYEKHLLLSEQYISNLEFLGFPGVYIDDEFTRGVEIQQVLRPEVRSQALKVVHDLFSLNSKIKEPDQLEIKLKKTIEHILDDILEKGDVMVNMLDIKNYSDYIFYHSVNVAMLSAVIGVRYGLSEGQLQQLMIAALLHDIGKKFIDQELVSEMRAQSEEEEREWRMHPKRGAEFIKNNFCFETVIVDSIKQHHEAYDGSGYPAGKAGEDITLYARIIRLADAYDAMTSRRPLHPEHSPSDAVEYLMAQTGRQFDPQLVDIFIHKIAVYPVGCEVELSTGQHAVVVQNFERFSLRPLVKVIGTGELKNLRDDAECRNITVIELILH